MYQDITYRLLGYSYTQLYEANHKNIEKYFIFCVKKGFSKFEWYILSNRMMYIMKNKDIYCYINTKRFF